MNTSFYSPDYKKYHKNSLIERITLNEADIKNNKFIENLNINFM